MDPEGPSRSHIPIHNDTNALLVNDIDLRVYGHHGRPFDLKFLQHFPQLTRFTVEVHALQDLSPLAQLNPGLRSLGLGATKSKRPDLSVLSRFPDLEMLYIEGHTKGIETISELRLLTDLALRSVTLPDLSVLLPLRRLRSLDIKLGGMRDLGLLPEIGRLEYLELWMIRGMCDLSPISVVSSLQFLFLQALRNVQALPDLSRLTRLRRLHLETMKGLSDLAPVAEAPSLEDLLVLDMAHLAVESFQPLVGHPSLRRTALGLGVRKRKAVSELLGLEEPGRFEPFEFTR